MRMIPTRVHAFLDYLIGALVLVSPWLFGFAGGAGAWLHVGLGAAILAIAALTNYELGVLRVIPVPAHLAVDGAIGVLALLSPWLFGFTTFVVLHVVAGLFEIGLALMTSTRPAVRPLRA